MTRPSGHVDTGVTGDDMWRWIRWWLLGLVALALAIQLVPYGRDHENAPVTAEPTWDSQATRDLAVRACFDCHSNETVWPWYSNIAPISWLIQHDVDEGREELNWSTGRGEGHESAETIREGRMPPTYYTMLHSGARLTSEEMDALAAGLTATFGGGR